MVTSQYLHVIFDKLMNTAIRNDNTQMATWIWLKKIVIQSHVWMLRVI